jgi:hypothetical protein
MNFYIIKNMNFYIIKNMLFYIAKNLMALLIIIRKVYWLS